MNEAMGRTFPYLGGREVPEYDLHEREEGDSRAESREKQGEEEARVEREEMERVEREEKGREYMHEALNLFDFSTVMGREKRSIVTSTVISKTRALLVAGKITLLEEQFLSYSEAPMERSRSLGSTRAIEPLLMVKGCGQGVASMPCLRIDMMDTNAYSEPVRDRDKDWRLDSQRDVLDYAGYDNALPPLGMGRYDYKNNNTLKLKTTIATKDRDGPSEATVKRKKHMFQFSMLISESHCIVDVLGEGIEGRIFVEGRNAGRAIVIQIYSFWNCKKYSITLTAGELVKLFTDVQRRDLMKPGMKTELIKAIVQRCYFTYKITIPSTNKYGKISATSSTGKTGPFGRHGKHGKTGRIGKEEGTDEGYTVIEVDHLTLPSIPFGYPQSVEGIIRETNLPPTAREFFSCPVLEQELKVGCEVRENFRLAKEREKPELLRRAEAERVRKQKEWDDTPKRKRGRVYSQVRRLDGRMIVFSGYRFPLKSLGVAQVYGFVCGLAEVLPITIVFSDVALIFKIRGLIKVSLCVLLVGHGDTSLRRLPVKAP